MREIKYRLWNDKEKIMIASKDILEIDLSSDCVEYFNGMESEVISFGALSKGRLLQYTGLKDITCTEIYEGDIVKLIEPLSCEPEKEKSRIGIVKFQYGSFYIYKEGSRYFLNSNCKVIGDIYSTMDEALRMLEDKERIDISN